MILLLLADGFEETEALVPLDLLRRGKLDVRTVGITGKTVTGAHGIAIALRRFACTSMRRWKSR